MSLLTIRELTVQYGTKKILDGVGLTLEQGRWLMLVGPNGAGKSTVVNAVTQGVPYAGRIELYLGLEIDYLNEESHPAIERFRRLPLDYRIGSVHLLYDDEGRVVDADLPADKFRQMVDRHFRGDVERVVRLYYERSRRMVELGGFDIVGHADKVHYNAACCRPGILDEPWYDRLVCDYFAEIARRGYQMEINTKAYEELGVFYPDVCYFPLLRELGVRVQVNSDAHYPERIASGMPEAFRALRRAGFTSVMQLQAGRWVEREIG